MTIWLLGYPGFLQLEKVISEFRVCLWRQALTRTWLTAKARRLGRGHFERATSRSAVYSNREGQRLVIELGPSWASCAWGKQGIFTGYLAGLGKP